MPMDQSCSWGRTEVHLQGATGWQFPSDPTDKQTDGVGRGMAPVQVPELVAGSGRREWPPAEQGTCLQISQTKKEPAK